MSRLMAKDSPCLSMASPQRCVTYARRSRVDRYGRWLTRSNPPGSNLLLDNDPFEQFAEDGSDSYRSVISRIRAELV